MSGFRTLFSPFPHGRALPVLLFLFLSAFFPAWFAIAAEDDSAPPPPAKSDAPAKTPDSKPKDVPAGKNSDGAASALAAASETADAETVAKRLFYKISLNESCFIKERELTVNARATVEILQGELDKISLEVFGLELGQGEIFNVSGENVRDWSVRRENSRAFLEIRPKDLGDKKTLTLTISGRQALKLPTTVSPILFTGTDSAAFFGIVQFLATSDLRIYAKQERGLIPIGGRSRSEASYALVGNPSLRLDVARANELLAPVSLENFSLTGTVSPEGTRFVLKAKAQVREIGAEAVVLSGNAALLDFPEKSDFVVLATSDGNGAPQYSLRFPARGTFDVELLFDAGIDDSDGWQRMNFCVPLAQVAPYSLSGMPADTVFAADNVSIPKPDGNGVFSGYLPTSGALNLRWRPSIPTPPEFSADVFSVDALSEMQIASGILLQKNEFLFSVSQGEISTLFFDVEGDGEILSVDGDDVLSWNAVTTASRRGIVVRLSRAKTENCRIRIISQTRAGEFPMTLNPLRFSPSLTDWEGERLASVCVHNNEFLRLRSGIGVRCEALQRAGMTQIAPTAFPQTSDFFEKDVPVTDAVSVYRLSGGDGALSIRADFVRPELIVSPRMRWFFDEEKTTARVVADFEVRDAPLYEMQILVPDDLELCALDSEIVAARELRDEPAKAGFRLLNLVFSKPVLGSGRVALTFQKIDSATVPATVSAENRASASDETTLRACLFPQAHFVFGTLGLSAQKKERLLPVAAENLSEIPPAEFSAERPPELAFRMRGNEWKLTVRREARPSVLAGVSSCVYKIEREKICGDLRVDYSSADGVPVQRVRLAFPRGAKIVSVAAKNLREWTADADGTATLIFAGAPGEKFSVAARFEQPRRDGETQSFNGVALLDTAVDAGTILLTADNVISLSERVPATVPVTDSATDPAAVPATEPAPENAASGASVLSELSFRQLGANADTARGGAILFRAFQFVARPFSLDFDVRFPAEESSAALVVTEMRVTADTARGGSEVDCDFRSFGASALFVGVPGEMQIAFPGAKEQGDGIWQLPLPPNTSTLRFRVLPRGGNAARPETLPETEKILLPRIFAPVAKVVFAGTGDAVSSTLSVVKVGRRLNASFGAELFGRIGRNFCDAGVFFAGAIVVALAALAASGRAARSSRFRAAKIYAVLSLVAATFFAVVSVWMVADALRVDYGETVLVAGMTAPGAQLDVTLRRFNFLGAETMMQSHAVQLLIAVFFAGIFLLFAGTVLRERARTASAAGAKPPRDERFLRTRVGGRILVYGVAAIFTVEDFPFHVPALVATIFVVEISVVLVQIAAIFVLKMKRSRDAGNSGGNALGSAALSIAVALFSALALFSTPQLRADETSAGTVAGTASEADATAEKFILSAASAEKETPHDVADRIAQAIDVLADRIVSRGDIRVTGIAGDRFDLLDAPAVLTSFEKNDKSMLRLERILSATGNYAYQVVLERAGTFGATFSYELALPGNAHGFALPTGAAAADVATVRVSRVEVKIAADGAVTTTSFPVGEKAQIAQIVFRPKASRRVEWKPQVRDRASETLRMFATGENLYVPAAGVIEGRHSLRFVPAQGEVSSVRVRIPKPFSVAGLEGSAIHRWNFNRDSGLLTVLFTAPRTTPFTLAISTQAQLSALPARRTFSALFALDCEEQVRTVGLATDETLQVDAVNAADALVSIDEDEFDAALAAAGMRVPAELRLRRAFRTVEKNAGEFDAELSAVRANLRVECTENFYVNNDSVRADIALAASVSRAELFKFSFKIPAGTDVDSVRGDALSHWTKENCDDGSVRVTLHLKNALEDTENFFIRFSGAFPRDTDSWTPPTFLVEDANSQRGEIVVHAEEGLRLNPVTAVPAQAENADGAQGDTFRFRYFNRANASPRFAVLESKPFTAATWLQQIRAAGRYAVSSVHAIFDIENVMRDAVQLRLPADALSPRFFGENVASAEKIPDGNDVWEIRFAKPVRGKVSVFAEFSTLLPRGARFVVPAVAVVGADTENAWLAVERGDVFTALAPHAEEKISVADLPEELRVELSADEASAEKISSAATDGNVATATEPNALGATDGNAATASGAWFIEKISGKNRAEIIVAPQNSANEAFTVSRLARRTAFSREKALTEEKFSLIAARSSVLRVGLPENGELKVAAVNGVPATVVYKPSSGFSSARAVAPRADAGGNGAISGTAGAGAADVGGNGEIFGRGAAADGEFAGSAEKIALIPVFAREGEPVTVEIVYEQPVRAVPVNGVRGLCAEIVAARVLSSDEISWTLCSGDSAAEIVDVFGFSPENVYAEDVEESAAAGGVLGAYFAGNSVPEARQTFRVKGSVQRKPSVRVAFVSAPAAPDAKLDFGFVFIVLCATVILKAALIWALSRFRRRCAEKSSVA